jgi:NADH-quinone oxidoreductase subunit H
MSMALAAIVMSTGSLKLTDVVSSQHEAFWGLFRGIENWSILTPYGFIAFIIFLICMVAETNRAPFDLPECESELVSGYNTEYSTKKWVLFMMGEYVNMLTYSAIATVVFLGGWHAIPVNFKILADSFPSTGDIWRLLDVLNGNSILGPLWFLGKMFFFMAGYIWLRASTPRLRYDQLMNLGWKVLLPVGVANLVVVGVWIVTTELYGAFGGWMTVAVAASLLYVLYRQYLKATKSSDSLQSRTVTMVDIPKPKPQSEEAVA